MANIFDINGKVIVVTGGLGQLGRNYSLALLESGAKVVVLDKYVTDSLVNSAFGAQANDESLIFLEADVTDRKSLVEAERQIYEAWGAPFGLVNNAALDSPPGAPTEENGPFETYPEESFDKVMEVNSKGVFLCCQVFGTRMASEGRGSIINISSTYGILSPDQTIYDYRRSGQEMFYKPVAYSVSKSSLMNLTRYLATYWAPQNVRVNTLTLAGVYNGQDERFLENYHKRVPLGRMAKEDEYSGAVIFLMSEASSYMTGSNMVIDGGWTAW